MLVLDTVCSARQDATDEAKLESQQYLLEPLVVHFICAHVDGATICGLRLHRRNAFRADEPRRRALCGGDATIFHKREEVDGLDVLDRRRLDLCGNQTSSSCRAGFVE